MSLANQVTRLNAENKRLRDELQHLHGILETQGRVSMGLMKALLDEVADRRAMFANNKPGGD